MQVRTTRLEAEDAKIIYQETAGLAIITIHRPQLKNALTANMWDQLAKIALQTLDNPKNKVLLLRGSGENFTAGSDIKEFNSISLEKAEDAFLHMENLKKKWSRKKILPKKNQQNKNSLLFF